MIRIVYYEKDENFNTVKIKKVYKYGLEHKSSVIWDDDDSLVETKK